MRDRRNASICLAVGVIKRSTVMAENEWLSCWPLDKLHDGLDLFERSVEPFRARSATL